MSFPRAHFPEASFPAVHFPDEGDVEPPATPSYTSNWMGLSFRLGCVLLGVLWALD